MTIKQLHARQILDSRGNPTVECDVILENGIRGRAAVPSGASTGMNEAIELRDEDDTRYLGKGVLKAVENVNTAISKAVVGMDAGDQEKLDLTMLSLDGTENKSKLGANAILSVSLAAAKASANALQKPLYEYIQASSPPLQKGAKGITSELKTGDFLLPLPMMNIINGGKHANFATDIQEYMILPVGAPTFSDALRMGAEIFHHLGKVIKKKGYETTVGDEGGYAPQVKGGNAEAFDLIIEAIEKAGYKLGKHILLGIDAAASEFFDPLADQERSYNLQKEGKKLASEEMVEWIVSLTQKYPIISLEDCLDQNDWKGWGLLTEKIGNKTQIVGDDLLVTNIKFLDKAIKSKAGNAILIKPNQIGTLTETILAVRMAQAAGWNTVMSHRSGETEDTTIAHLAVGLSTAQIKTGSLSRSDRNAKYNELLRIEEYLGAKAKFPGKKPFNITSAS
jgi:enolase